MKRTLRVLLTLALVLGLLGGLPRARAVLDLDTLGDYYITQQQDYAVAPGVTETTFAMNTAAGDRQSVGHVLTVDLSDPTVELRTGYCNYDGSRWGMQTPTRQVAAAEQVLRQSEPTATVVGLTNANFYNMTTGEPCGPLVMHGVKYHDVQAGYCYFAVLKDGTAQIRDSLTPMGDDVLEAVGGREILLRDGQIVASEDTDYNPRTAVGITAQGKVVLFVCEGRQKPLAWGVGAAELGRIMQQLGCVDALNLDGGGSTTFMSRRAGDDALALNSKVSDGYLRSIAASLMVVSTAPAPEPVQSHTHSWVLGADDTVSCPDCGEMADRATFTGLVTRPDGSRSCLIGGQVKTGWITWGEEMLHAGDDGILHRTTTSTTMTCTKNGYLYANCSCGKRYTGSAVWRRGHSWDENHVCTVCGFAGKDIGTLEGSISSKSYLYRAGGCRPSPTVKDGDKTLDIKNSGVSYDGFVFWQDCDHPGTARLEIEGRGDYYGTMVLTYKIVLPSVGTVTATDITEDSLRLHWKPVEGAEGYNIYRYDYTAKDHQLLASVDGQQTDTAVVAGLTPSTNYTLCVRARAMDGDELCLSYSYSWLYTATTAAQPDPEDGTLSVLEEVCAPLSETEVISLQQGLARRCLFLPAYADLSALPLQIRLTQDLPITLTGSLGSAGLENGVPATLDLTALTQPDTQGCYRLELTAGELEPVRILVLRSSVPAMFITSQDPETQGRAYVDASKDHASAGTVRLIQPDGSVRYDGGFSKLKARGNTTFVNAEKKSYQIKLSSKADLLGAGEKPKTFVLLAGYFDASLMHDKLFKDLALNLGMDNTPRESWVDLYYDGEYRGTYLLGEKVDVGSTAVDITDMEELYEGLNPDYGESPRLVETTNRFGKTLRYTEDLTEPEDLTGGWLLELNNTKYDEASGFTTLQGVALNVKSPEWAGKAAMEYISEYYQEFENAVYAEDHTGRNPDTGKYYYEYVDKDSLVRMYLLEQLSANVDSFYSSFFFYKEAGQIMYAGPAWDYDMTMGTGWSDRVTYSNEFANRRYLAKALVEIPGFLNAVKRYYTGTFRAQALAMTGKNGAIRQNAAYTAASAAMNYQLWPYIQVGNPYKANHIWTGATFASVVDFTDNWLIQRIGVLDGMFYDENVPDDPIDDGPDVTTPTQTPVITPPDTQPELPYVDVVKGSFYYDAVVWAHFGGITKGTDETHFSPLGDCTRGQIVTLLWRAAGCPEPKTFAMPFADVSVECYCGTAVLWAVEQGITKGTSETTFSPNRACTRGQAVTFLYRYTGAQAEPEGHPFTDVPAGAYYAAPISWAYAHQVVNGMTPTTFAPDATCSRAQIVTILYRFFE